MWNNTENKNFCFLDLSEIIANHGSKLLFGNGFILSSEHEEYQLAIDKIKNWINLESFFYQVEKINSYYGYSIILIDKTKTGRIGLTLAQPYAVSRVAKIFENEEMAVTWSRVQYDDQAIYIRTEYTKNDIKRQFTSDVITLDGSQEKISKDLELPIYEKHNLGIIPVIFMQNLPKKNFFGGVVGDFYPDMSPVKKMQDLLDHTWEQTWKELEFNRTRVFLDITRQEMEQYNNAYELKRLVGDFIIQTNMGTLGSTNGKAVEILQGNPQLEAYANFIQFIIDKTFEGAGYSPLNDTTSQKTEAEVLITNSRDAETTRIKRTIRTYKYNLLFQKIFIILGLDGDISKWTFEIKENTIMDRLKQIEISSLMVREGFSTRRREIAKINGVSLEESEIIKAEIDKEHKNDIIDINMQNISNDIGEKDNVSIKSVTY